MANMPYLLFKDGLLNRGWKYHTWKISPNPATHLIIYYQNYLKLESAYSFTSVGLI